MDEEKKKIKVINALENPDYNWRTIEGLANETGLSQEEVNSLINSLNDIVIRSPEPDGNGSALYTTKDHYYNTHNIFPRAINVIAGKIK